MKKHDTLDKSAQITLREITEETLWDFLSLKVHEKQESFVASNAISIAQAHFSKHAWFRGIYADETAVGFVMLEDNPEKPEYYLWRFMIGENFQKMGFGYKAMKEVIEHVKARPNATELITSVVPGEGNPQGFYEKLGFRLTGEIDEGEEVMKLVL